MRTAVPEEVAVRARNLLLRFAPETVDQAPARRRGSIVGVYAARGGAGATTVAVNLGLALHRQFGRRVAIVDGNLQFGDHRIFFDLPRDTPSLLDLVGAPDLEVPTLTSASIRHASGVDLLLGPTSPTAAELVGHDDLPRVLEAMRPLYDYLVVDMGRQLDEYNLRVLDVADLLLVVLNADLPSLKNTRLVLETAGDVGFPENRVHLVLNRSTAATGIDVSSAEDALSKRIDHQVVNDFKAGVGSVNSGNPVLLGRPDSALGKSIIALASAVDEVPPLRTRTALVARR
jgi:pilus assembly protein CpaE